MKVGDIVKLKRFDGAQVTPMLWMRCQDAGSSSRYAECVPLTAGSVLRGGDEPCDDDSWYVVGETLLIAAAQLNNDGDKWVVVPEDKVPDWVWAKIARQALGR